VSSGKTKLVIHPRLRVVRREGASSSVKTRKFFRLSGISPPIVIEPFNNCIDTLERAVNERVFFVKNREGQYVEPPKPSYKHFTRTMTAAGEAVVKNVSKTTPLSRLAFVESFRGRKLINYTNAYQSILNRGFRLDKDAKIRVFVKCEKTDHTTKVDPVPRVISPRDPRYNIEVGRYLRKIEERIFKSIGIMFGHETVIKGFDAVKSAAILSEKWNMFSDPVAIGLDASRFDQHVSKPALQFEHYVYTQCFAHKHHRDSLSVLLKAQLENRCDGYTPDGHLHYKTDGGRMSGDMNTSLGNCLIMCCMIYSYLKELGIEGHLANNGDDCVVFMDKKNIEMFQSGLFEWFEKMGFNMTMEKPVYNFEEIEFCQTHPVHNGNAYIMCRNPHTALAKDTVLLKPAETVQLKQEWMAAVGKGGLALTGGLPVFQDFYQMFERAGVERGLKLNDEVFGWGVRHMIGTLCNKYRPVEPYTRASFYWAFGITPDAQIELEKVYKGLTIDVGRTDQLFYRHDLCLKG